MAYDPNVRVWIGQREVTNLRDGDVVVRRGRDTVYQPTNAGYASFELVDIEDVFFEVNARVTITVDDFAGTPQLVFTGRVSDFERQMRVLSADPQVIVRVQAVGPLAAAHRRVVLFDGRLSENDGDRVAAALAVALAERWDEQPLDLAWEDVGATVTWDTYDSFAPELIDDGLFDLTALPADDAGYDPLGVIQDAAFSGQGILFETPDGRVGYANADRRFANLLAGVVDIPLNVTVFNRFSVSQQLADVTNRVTVEYGADEAVTATEPESLTQFGRLESQQRTILVNESNAQAFAERFLERQAFPVLRLQQIGIGLEVVESALLDSLLVLGTCGCTDAVELSGIPARFGLTQFQGFVEGVEWILGRSSAQMILFVSDQSLSIGPVRWSAVPGTIQWQDVNAALEWQDARSI